MAKIGSYYSIASTDPESIMTMTTALRARTFFPRTGGLVPADSPVLGSARGWIDDIDRCLTLHQSPTHEAEATARRSACPRTTTVSIGSPQNGRFVGVLRDNEYVSHGALIRWDAIKLLEFLHLPKE